MNRSVRFFLGAALALVVLVAVVALPLVFRRTASQPTAEFVTLNCIGGSEKSGLLADQEVQQILRDTYALAVDFQGMGSLEQAQLATDDLKQRGVHCLWPSSASAQLVFEAKHTLTDFAGYRAETVLNSPEVIYAGPETVDVLQKAGVVEQRNNSYFIINMKQLLLDYVLEKKQWEDIGAPTLRGPIIIESTNPAQSNSGFTAFLLKLMIISTNDVRQPPTVEQARKALPTIRALYEAQGLQSRSSAFGFDQWLIEGGEVSAPLYAGYESQIIEKVVQYPTQVDQLLRDVRVLYPDPTVFNAHPILALNADGRRLIDAMKDPQIQAIAWQRYGFRSILLGVTDVANFPKIPLADRVQSTNVPGADVILLLQDCLVNNKCN